ncbi:hypothetical protein CC86DRAFT_406151 [Ophiobolus disseminans]|uniref:Uncharacterized protein n=1 Tax=Ophiobolus disseminans TaxID=1469910 RepID=A0A6A7A0Q8_9PLEO|nr:hypothetical protein CC86DRAFT_406151 [Ophiobolus disseminans]
MSRSPNPVYIDFGFLMATLIIALSLVLLVYNFKITLQDQASKDRERRIRQYIISAEFRNLYAQRSLVTYVHRQLVHQKQRIAGLEDELLYRKTCVEGMGYAARPYVVVIYRDRAPRTQTSVSLDNEWSDQESSICDFCDTPPLYAGSERSASSQEMDTVDSPPHATHTVCAAEDHGHGERLGKEAEQRSRNATRPVHKPTPPSCEAEEDDGNMYTQWESPCHYHYHDIPAPTPPAPSPPAPPPPSVEPTPQSPPKPTSWKCTTHGVCDCLALGCRAEGKSRAWASLRGGGGNQTKEWRNDISEDDAENIFLLEHGDEVLVWKCVRHSVFGCREEGCWVGGVGDDDEGGVGLRGGGAGGEWDDGGRNGMDREEVGMLMRGLGDLGGWRWYA